MKPTEKRMTAERCAYLMSVAMANDLDEVWLSGNPELFFLYLYQYFPTITRRYIDSLIYFLLQNVYFINLSAILH